MTLSVDRQRMHFSHEKESMKLFQSNCNSFLIIPDPKKTVELLLLLLHELKFKVFGFCFCFGEPMSEPHNCYCYVTAPLFNYIGLIVFGVYFFLKLLFLLSCGSFPYNFRLCQSQSVCHVYHVLRFFSSFIFMIFPQDVFNVQL